MNNRVPVPNSYIDSIVRDPALLSESIRDALLSVRRHRFLDGWFRLDIVDHMMDYHYVSFDRSAPSADKLSIIYSNQALITAHDKFFPTSSTSQPALIARMLQLIDLSPGMQVLEIGTGTGYNAALLAELSGEPSHVFTIEYQQSVAEKAMQHLQDEGYGAIHVTQGDGFKGVAEGAPFDRLVATVGCSDISPHWLKQLSPDGMMLIPLNHGFSDPLTRLTPDPKDPTRAVGEIVERSAFMRIQGLLKWGNPWRSFSIRGLSAEPLWVLPLPDHLEVSDPLHHPVAENNHWCFHFFLALCSRELWNDNRGYGLADPSNNSVVLITPNGLEAYSATSDPDACEHLHERLMAIHQRWTNLGWPAPADFQLTLIPKMQIDASLADPMREWTIERPYFLETIRLP
jgi:protein-L-isoaspartate(D-aspartate) O-methyltransferase